MQGLLTGNNRQALVGGLSPYANEFIKGQTEENSLENKIAHGILSAVEFQLTGQSAYLGALTGIVAESSAEILAGIVYGKAPGELTEGEKQQVVALSQAAAALATVVAGGNGETAASAMASAKSAVENNFLSQSEYAELDRLMDKKNLTVEEATRVQYLLEKDKISNQLLDRWQQDPDSLSQQDRELLFKWVREYGNTPSQLKLLETPAYAPQLKPDYSDLKFRAQKTYNDSANIHTRLTESTATGLSFIGLGGSKAIINGYKYIDAASKGIVGVTENTVKGVGTFINKYPKATEGILVGSISTGYDIYNDDVSLEKTMMNYVLGRGLAGKSLDQQLSINAIYKGITSVNENKPNDEIISTQVSSAVSTTGGSIIESLLESGGVNGISKQILSNLASGYLESQIESNEQKDNKDKK